MIQSGDEFTERLIVTVGSGSHLREEVTPGWVPMGVKCVRKSIWRCYGCSEVALNLGHSSPMCPGLGGGLFCNRCVADYLREQEESE